MKLDPARSAHIAHLAILQLLFFNSVANTAPRWESSFFLQSTLPDSYMYRYNSPLYNNIIIIIIMCSNFGDISMVK